MKQFVLYKDGTKIELQEPSEEYQRWPVALLVEGKDVQDSYPIWDGNSHSNLYARLMTLVEATTEDPKRRKALKDLYAKEITAFSDLLYKKAKHFDSNRPVPDMGI